MKFVNTVFTLSMVLMSIIVKAQEMNTIGGVEHIEP